MIGGGPAGAAAAIQLARAGVAVTLLEREQTPAHKVCGEFLSGEALAYLRQLGVDLPGLQAVPLSTVRFAGRGGTAERTLPFPAMSLTRHCLDGHLLTRAEAAEVNVRRGCRVERLERAGTGWRASLRDGQQLLAPAVFLATGKHDLRGHPRAAGRQPDLVGLKMYWRLNTPELLALGDAVELIEYTGGYAGLQPVEGSRVNLCCLLQRDTLRQLGGTWAAVLSHMLQQSPHLRKRLRNAEPLLDKPLTIAPLPYGYVRQHSGGIWRLGDQAAVIPSFTGDGMSLALHTGMLAADHYLQGRDADTYQQAVAAQAGRQVSFATAISKALVRMPGLCMKVCMVWPGIIDRIARQTRIAPGSLLKVSSPGKSSADISPARGRAANGAHQ